MLRCCIVHFDFLMAQTQTNREGAVRLSRKHPYLRRHLRKTTAWDIKVLYTHLPFKHPVLGKLDQFNAFY